MECILRGQAQLFEYDVEKFNQMELRWAVLVYRFKFQLYSRRTSFREIVYSAEIVR